MYYSVYCSVVLYSSCHIPYGKPFYNSGSAPPATAERGVPRYPPGLDPVLGAAEEAHEEAELREREEEEATKTTAFTRRAHTVM